MNNFIEEKRKQDRIKQHSFLRLNEKLALLIDISVNGMRLAVENIPDDPNVEIKISIEGTEFNLSGITRWFSEKNNFSGLYYLGIFIEDPPRKYEKLITKLLN